MENITIAVIVIVTLLIIAFITYLVITLINPKKKDNKDNETAENFRNLYTISSPWIDTKSVEGDMGKCNLYTFTSNNPYTPATITFNDLNNCYILNNCSYVDNAYCYDPDQIFAIRKKHECDDLITENCLQQNGQLVPTGTIEEFFQRCNPTPSKDNTKNISISNKLQCKGELSLIAFNLKEGTFGPNIFDDSVCMQMSNDGTILQNICDMREIYVPKGGGPTPSQLFRIERANYVDNKFVPNDNGIFVKIVTRPNNLVLTPDVENSDLKLTEVDENKGYFWAFIPEITDPRVDNPLFKSPSQIVFIRDPKKLPALNDTLKLWNYLVDPTNNIKSIQIDNLCNNVPVKFDDFFVYNFTQTTTINSTQYLNYSILPVLMQNPEEYSF